MVLYRVNCHLNVSVGQSARRAPGGQAQRFALPSVVEAKFRLARRSFGYRITFHI